MKRIVVLSIVASVCVAVFADSVALKSGVAINECTVLQENAGHVVLLYGSGIIRVDRGDVDTVTKGALNTPPPADVPNHLPSYRSIVSKLSSEAWATDLQQIPATVVSVGIMRNVPYKSHKVGDNYEINVYGDPSAPAGFEIGIKNGLLNDEKARAHCVEFVSSLLNDSADRDALRALKKSKDLVTRNGVTYEITPATDPDAYDGWWISVYSETALNSVRASDKELAAITVPKVVAAHVPTPNQSAEQLEIERRNAWNQEEMRHARTVKIIPLNGAQERVYNRDYGRHEGAYVPHHHKTITMRR